MSCCPGGVVVCGYRGRERVYTVDAFNKSPDQPLSNVDLERGGLRMSILRREDEKEKDLWVFWLRRRFDDWPRCHR